MPIIGMTLVLLGPQQQLRQLAGCVVGYEDLLASDSPQIVPAASIDQGLAWTIDNKYYNAEISFSFHPTDHSLPATLGDYDGAIVMAHSKDKFDAESIAALASGDDDRLRLLVHLSEGDSNLDDVEHYTQFAVCNGFEFIEVNTQSLTADHDARDKFGLPRLIEALQSHLWSTMRRKPKGTPGPPLAEKTLPAAAQSITSVPSAPSADQPKRTEMPPNPFIHDGEDMPGMEELVQTMMQANALRDEVIQGNLSDEDRRTQAANFALRLMELLDLGEDEDEED